MGILYVYNACFFYFRDVAKALLSSKKLTVDNRVFFESVFKLLLKLVFFLDYKENRMVFMTTMEKSFQFVTNSSSRDHYNPAVEVRILHQFVVNFINVLHMN